MTNWFYKFMGEEVGPMSSSDLVAAAIEGHVEYDTYVRRENDSNWVSASSVSGLFEKAQTAKEQLEADLAEQLRRAEAESLRDQQRLAQMTISTSAPSADRPFDILDTVFALDSDGSAGLFSGSDGDPNVAFERAKQQLRLAAFAIGADAVINCQFEYRVAVATNATGEAIGNALSGLLNTNAGLGNSHAQAIEIFAYGTAIQYRASSRFDDEVSNAR